MRYEFKYIVPNSAMNSLRAQLLPFVDIDQFAESSSENHYTVRSIYFDSPSYDFYFEKIEGIKNRKKVRLRGYNEMKGDDKVFFEIKRKYDTPIVKYRAPMLYEEALHLLKIRSLNGFEIANIFDSQKIENSKRFLYQVFSKNLRPVVLIVYEREPYLSKFDSTVRITFDKNLRGNAYPALEELYTEPGLSPVMKDKFILEVKFNKSFPNWLTPILGMYNLRRQSASKYVITMDGCKVVKNLSKSALYTQSKWYK